jgi:hypothetical protein
MKSDSNLAEGYVMDERSEKGERATASIPGIKTKNISVMAAMTKNG